MKIAMLAPIAWRTPPRHYGPWERVVSLLTEGLAKKGIDVTLFATGDSITSAKLEYICPLPYEEDPGIDPKVWEALHIAHVFERADDFDLIHNHYDFMPLVFSRLIKTPLLTTIHGFSSSRILPVYRQYQDRSYYVSISDADRSPELSYISTIYHGIDLQEFTFQKDPGEYLLYFGRIHPDKGTREAIEIARQSGFRLYMAGIIQDKEYFNQQVAPYVDNETVFYLGSVGPAQRNELLGRAFALLHPIHFKEPFGLSVIEAMACGTPVIAFNKGSMPEVIRHGETGFLVNNVQEARQALLHIPAVRRSKCRDWVAEYFSVERMVDEYTEVYRQLINSPKKALFC